MVAFVDGDGCDVLDAAADDRPGVAGVVGAATGWRGDDEASFASSFGEDVTVGGACKFRVFADASSINAVEDVHAAGWCPFAVSINESVE